MIMPRVYLKTDFRNFEQGVIAAVAKVGNSSKNGMRKAVKEFMNDALDKQPMVPRDKGSLEASHSVFVDGKLVATSAGRSVTEGGSATPLTILSRISTRLEGALVAHKSYAASLHEGISRWGTPYVYSGSGRGRKWIEAKLLRFFGKYYGMIAGEIRRAK